MEPQEPGPGFTPRLGTFFILVGLGFLVLFVLSVIGQDTKTAYLLLSIAALFLGYLFRRRAPKHDSGRFGTIRRIRERSRQRRQERMSRKKKR